jgi:hypothetical protein
MTNTCRLLRTIFFVTILLICQAVSAEENQTQFKKILVGISPFTMNPNDKIVGFKLAIASGKVDFAKVPKGWNCQTSGTPGLDQTMYCYSPSPSNALYNSSMLPETTIFDMSTIGGNPLNYEVTIEIENGDGKTYSKQLWRSQLSIR